MDYYSVESDILDSLDYLIPPVKKTNRKHSTGKYYIPDFSRQPDVHLIRKFCAAKHTKHNSTEATDGASSTSVVIRKAVAKNPKRKFITNKFFDDETSVEIPLIKVTVIPKVAETQTSRVFNKRRQILKRIQSTISNQESSIHSKNVYLVVTGQKTDKIYKIKTSGSENLSCNQSSSRLRYEDIPLKKISNYKRLINSLNMDKKKKKERKRKTNIVRQKESKSSLVNEIFGGAGLTLQECMCSNTKKKEALKNVSCRKSRLQITGQLGLTNNENYVLDYTATMNDKPVIANFTHVEHRLIPNEVLDSQHERRETKNCTTGCYKSNVICNNKKYTARTQRDSNVQANLQELTTYRTFSKKGRVRQESQGIQVDLDTTFPADKISKKQLKNQTIQCFCNCSNVTDIVSTTTGDVTNRGTIKEIRSPLVIISVYPKQDASENVSSHTLMKQRPISPKKNTTTVVQKAERNYNKSTPRDMPPSRSPSPTKQNFTKENPFNRTVDTRFLRTDYKMKNSNYQSSSNVRKKVAPTTESSNNTTKSNTKAKFYKKFPVSFSSRDSKGINNRSPKKKNFVDNYTKPIKVSKKDAGNDSSLWRNNSSGVKVNIDSGKGRYNVMWHQSNVNTNLRVRKVIKDQESQKSTDDEYASMENYLMLSEGNKDRKRSVSQTLCCSQASGTEYDDTSQHSDLDTIVNSDRSDSEPKVCMKTTQTCDICDEFYGSQSSTNFFAPIKHYHGDNCKITDPLERDKEIRELLGVQPSRPAVSRSVTQDYLSGIFCRDAQYRFKRNSDFIPSKRSIAACMSRSMDCKCCNTECCSTERKLNKNRQCKMIKTKTTTTQCEKKTPSSTPCCSSHQPRDSCDMQQLVLNRNIQVYLQIEQFTKQKPIMLTRKQYDKLKKTIKSTVKLKLKNQDKCKKNIFKAYSVISSGHVKKAPKKVSCVSHTQGIQTFKCGKKSRRQSTKDDRICSSKDLKRGSCVCEAVQTVPSKRSIDRRTMCNTYMLYKEQNVNESANLSAEDVPRHARSSLEIRYANVAYKRVTFSSTNVGNIATESLYSKQNDNYSMYSLLKRHKKSATPNLGTSAYSLYSEATGSDQSIKYLLSPRGSKQKRPLLRRLMSCLVMHSARESNIKIPCGLTSKVSGVNSSIDSYYISTSLGAIEVTSSMYDTSASYYTNHTILPVDKMKRGFLKSVRGFLASKRS